MYHGCSSLAFTPELLFTSVIVTEALTIQSIHFSFSIVSHVQYCPIFQQEELNVKKVINVGKIGTECW
jgi:hypothetical protein